MTSLYVDNEPYVCQWTENLMHRGIIPAGRVLCASVETLQAHDLAGFDHVHLFSGISVWAYALRQAGWADDRPAWTLSCPCQPFSSAGRKKGFNDRRHLWPHAFRLISECRPGAIFGEQVSSQDGLAWLDVVQDQLEGCGYAVGALAISAAGVGAPHIRKRLYFVADAGSNTHTDGCNRPGVSGKSRETHSGLAGAGDATDASGDADEQRRQGRGLQPEQCAGECPAGATGDEADSHCPDATSKQVGVAGQSRGEDAGSDSTSQRRDRGSNTPEPAGWDGAEDSGPLRGFWADAEWLPTIDGRWMPTERGLQPLAARHPGRVERLRAYGNSLCAETAIEFVRAYMECRP